MTGKVIVTLEDCRTLGFCMGAVRPWFEQHGFDWRDFVRNGIEADRLLATDDHLARMAVSNAEARHG